MENLSSLNLTLRDYALTIAKRNGNSCADELHLLAAIRQFYGEEFDRRFPGQAARIEALLAERRWNSLERPAFDEGTLAMLLAFNDYEDAWELAELLVDMHDNSDPEGNGAPMPLGKIPDPDRATAPAAQASGSDGLIEAESRSVALLLDEGLAKRVAVVLELPTAEVARAMAADALAIAVLVAGSEFPIKVRKVICSSLGLQSDDVPPRDALSDMVHRVSHAPSEESGRTGTELALALVDVGEWVAALDDSITRTETDRIDEIRLLLRDQLGDRIRNESDAFLSFDREFSRLVGMQAVKHELRKRVEFLIVSRSRAARGHKVEVQRSHMAFLGNPGTGKTTVARLYGKLLHEVGLLPSNKLIETDRSGLVGAFVGHSEKKTMEVIESADGGVLFIDEAYALNDNYGSQKGFGEEATDVLVKQMEDRRDRLVVIVAGYSKPMQQFLSMNPGLKSRIPVVLDFPDYTDEELVTIAERIASRRSLLLGPESKEKVRAVMAKERVVEGFGNAREVENLLDAAQRNILSRVSRLGNLATSSESSTIIPEDIPDATEPVAKKPLGFFSKPQ